jgi:hypothetical protein
MTWFRVSSKLLPILALFVLFAMAAKSQAGILFNFNSPTINPVISSQGGETDPPGDAIEAYMSLLYGSDVDVALGAKLVHNKPENIAGFNVYLGNTDVVAPFVAPPLNPNVTNTGVSDNYLINRWNASSLPPTVRDRIVIEFTQVPIIKMSVDWQIFPINSTTATADLTIKADGNQIFYYDNDNTHAERIAGKMGHFSITFANPVHKLEFIDWTDAPIGIDNLWVESPPEDSPPVVPEPTTLLIWTGFAGALVATYRRRRK